jgi:hypothetical protein
MRMNRVIKYRLKKKHMYSMCKIYNTHEMRIISRPELTELETESCKNLVLAGSGTWKYKLYMMW